MFLYVLDEIEAKRLIKSNYKLLHKKLVKDKEVFVFVDSNKLTFSAEDSKKILRVNRLYF